MKPERDITVVLDQILAAIQDDQWLYTHLSSSFESIRSSARYMAPEIRHLLWSELAQTLTRHDRGGLINSDQRDKIKRIVKGLSDN